jgi:hypothetical protein
MVLLVKFMNLRPYRFLLAKLQTNYVLETPDAAERNRQLGQKFASEPTEAYGDLMNRMTPNQRAFALKILSWLFYAQRILSMRELQHALAVQIGQRLDPLDITFPEVIVQSCGGLVDHNLSSNLVTFSHALVRQFLEGHQAHILRPPSEIAMVCLTYMRHSILAEAEVWPTFWQSSLKSSSDDEYPLAAYVIPFWASHSRMLNGSTRNVGVEREILDTFSSEERRNALTALKRKREGRLSATEEWALDTDENPGSSWQQPLLIFLVSYQLEFVFVSPLADSFISST